MVKTITCDILNLPIMVNKTTKKILVKDIMTTEVMSAHIDMSVLDVAKVLSEHNFNGMPVVDKENKVLGIITEFDLIEKASEATLNTLRSVLHDVYNSKEPNSNFKKRSEEIYPLKVGDIMTKNPMVISPDAPFEELIDIFRKNQRINPIPVVDKENKLLGLVSRSDLLKSSGIYRM